MQALRQFYQSRYYKKSLYGVIGLGVIGAILVVSTKIRKQQSKQQSLNQFQSNEQSLQGTIFNKLDKCSLSNIDQVKTLNTSISLEIDFVQQILTGRVILKMKAIKSVNKIQLDAKMLSIKGVKVNDQETQFHYKELVVKELGDQLEIFTEKQENEEFQVEIIYSTQQNINNEQVAQNWLQPSQTFGNKHPFLFTQSEAIYARSLYPCQDSPSIKSTFDIELTVPAPLKAFGSGLLVQETSKDNKNIFQFKQPVAIPSYLFAICAGDLEKKKISERTFVISEPILINKCANEFSDMEKYLSTIEEYLTPYKWNEYTVIVLPKAFPYGGMENPNLTFLSPSLVVGDKSETAVLIHEMIHSWSGNSMTCQNWECFWLNEGITTFIENKMVGKIFGKDQQTLHGLLGDNSLQKSINNFGAEHTYTTLSPKLDQQNPDDCFSVIPYQKGCQFLRFLEGQIGEQKFQEFIRLIVSQDTLNSEQFRSLLEKFLLENNIEGVDIQWQSWIIDPGMPKEKLKIEEQFSKKYEKLANDLYDNQMQLDDFQNLHSNEKCFILDLIGNKDIDQRILKNLEEEYQLFESNNPEILHRILIYGIKNNYPVALGDKLSDFLRANGRMKFICPVYRALAEKNREIGLRIFNMCKNSYHSIASAQIQKMFGI
ncbi:unnamed protein product (macronuclear) [Paramecium tetraurelia]|uniref:Peptidase M1 leukotriene A4 hydrolase/aminopeptidase C-terminal domain-containing protein n=1 Tax=Paramecium tetraurelia TaxID=5888 RepID=A0EHI8_PARTE|nr:uncharacterized protein GSPATT00027103001 [Paramecium tetraurelia]CAK94779.1 unnamed protein product [Paramecium tetraurelia]|eukprot:XP_001462152.1 hypothetical protein (macronuclear) [Paramecium tetraurelia strain d4-2]